MSCAQRNLLADIWAEWGAIIEHWYYLWVLLRSAQCGHSHQWKRPRQASGPWLRVYCVLTLLVSGQKPESCPLLAVLMHDTLCQILAAALMCRFRRPGTRNWTRTWEPFRMCWFAGSRKCELFVRSSFRLKWKESLTNTRLGSIFSKPCILNQESTPTWPTLSAHDISRNRCELITAHVLIAESRRKSAF